MHVCRLNPNPQAPHGYAYECVDCKKRFYCTPKQFDVYLKDIGRLGCECPCHRGGGVWCNCGGGWECELMWDG